MSLFCIPELAEPVALSMESQLLPISPPLHLFVPTATTLCWPLASSGISQPGPCCSGSQRDLDPRHKTASCSSWPGWDTPTSHRLLREHMAVILQPHTCYPSLHNLFYPEKPHTCRSLPTFISLPGMSSLPSLPEFPVFLQEAQAAAPGDEFSAFSAHPARTACPHACVGMVRPDFSSSLRPLLARPSGPQHRAGAQGRRINECS